MLALIPLLATLVAARPTQEATSEPARSVVVTSELVGVECLSAAYYGSYGGSSENKEHIYLPTSDWLGEITSLSDGATTVPSTDKGRVVWVGPAGVDPSLLVKEDINVHWQSIKSFARLHANTAREGRNQHAFTSNGEYADAIELLHQSETSLLLHVPQAYLPVLDTLLPAHLVPVALPTSPLSTLDGWETVPKHLVENLANITANLQFDPLLSRVLNEGLQMDSVRRDVRWLTGEGPSGIESRHSFTAGAIKAAHWIKGESPP
jgi:hypothetical protein